MMENIQKPVNEDHTQESFGLVKGKKELNDYLFKRGLDEEQIIGILSKIKDCDDFEIVVSRLASYIHAKNARPNIHKFNSSFTMR